MTGVYLPNAESAVIPERKIVSYLLSDAHPDGRGKARFFSMHGFSIDEWQTLAFAFRRHAVENLVFAEVETAFGVRYLVDGKLHAPDGRTPNVRVVWFVERDDDVPRLVTAYPIGRRLQP